MNYRILSLVLLIEAIGLWQSKHRSYSEKVAEVAITYEDRLTRFGQEFLETLFSCCGVRLTVLEPGEEQTPQQELTDDLLALIASFSGRMSGMRSHKQKELLQCATAVLTSS